MRDWDDRAPAERPPLDAEGLREVLVRPAGPYTALDVVECTGSTNSDLMAAALEGAADRTVLIAETQTAGRGRMRDRQWFSPPRAGLYFSVLYRPDGVPFSRLGWLVMLAGVAVVNAVAELCEVQTRLKWPNDLLAGPDLAKCGGILAEVVPVPGQETPAVVLGIGLNVHQTRDELPVGPGGLRPTSLGLQEAVNCDRQLIVRSVLAELARAEAHWRAAGGDPAGCGLVGDYRSACATLGRQVRVELPGGADLHGVAADVDLDGRLVIRTTEGALRPVSAGDVIHLRPVQPQGV
ncbi:BirA family biotin operon repressor/biotin-[acetyl-CoA-carboxylase] ligase [Crossiella equi]|uniref:biotin--[biotin carboxyl-carrier protein] ligase n=1 Tax=Crossiella equi TaxID=130796 RepID=A0ABS5ADI4_9PSEU|nr:biotin--[acetyl-CoA-carboxylase] ligase [Crossiella equi]MBP2474645.1 BirA family biotin operon repressor/biotin-[acetyl-CoA-carboxylase] ligase [Crossiella equi]